MGPRAPGDLAAPAGEGATDDPPRGWTDEFPTVLRDGSVLFVRTRDVSHWTPDSWHVTEHGTLELLSHGKLTAVADVTASSSDPGSLVGGYYGHYSWPLRVAVRR